MKIKNFIIDKTDQVARILYRENGSKKFSQISRDIVMDALVISVLLAALILIWNKFQDSQHLATLEIVPSRWSVALENSAADCWGEKRAAECLASPDNNRLWNSKILRRDPEYFRLLAADLKQPFWMGLKITTAELKRANSLGASRLMLGMLYSGYEVWVDGERVQVGDFLENDLPIALDLTTERMQREKPLHIAIAVFRSGKMQTIDSDWFVPTMGFYTSKASDQQIRWTAFTNDTRYYIMFAVFFLFGLIFRYAAVIKKTNVEYSAASGYSLVLALSQFIVADSTFRMLGPGIYYPLLNATLFAEIFAVIGFGLAFSRGPAALLKLVNLGIPISFLSVFLVSRILNDNGKLTEWIIFYLTPLSYFTSGLFCLLQYLSLKINSKTTNSSKRRRLLLASMSLIFVSVAISFIAETLRAQAVEAHWVRILAAIPLYILTTSIAAAVQKNYRIFETTSISPFHKLSPLPESVSGVIINLDLKSSEKLFRTGAHEEVGGTIVSTVLSQIWGRFAASGATVMQSSGDDILLIYPDTQLHEDPLIWYKTLCQVHEELQLIAQQLADTQPELATLKCLEFRAAASKGSVRPLWRVIGTTRVPAWVEAGNKNVFVDTARLLELERARINSTPPEAGSILIADESLESDIKDISGPNIKTVTGQGKHGRVYRGFAVAVTAAPEV